MTNDKYKHTKYVDGVQENFVDIEDFKEIKKALQSMLSAYDTAYTSAQIEARNSCSECLVMMNKIISNQPPV